MRKGKPVFGVGINDLDSPIYANGKHTHVYAIWKRMLQRCYDTKEHAVHPTYLGCTVHPHWKHLAGFKPWFDKHYRPGFELDKDILVRGNKMYGPETCCFVPHRINTLLLDKAAARGDLPLGVTRNGTGFMAQCSYGHSRRITKTFRTLEEAVAWYKYTKGRMIRHAATNALVLLEIDQRVHTALLLRAHEIEAG